MPYLRAWGCPGYRFATEKQLVLLEGGEGTCNKGIVVLQEFPMI
jgi:hypothetical protein